MDNQIKQKSILKVTIMILLLIVLSAVNFNAVNAADSEVSFDFPAEITSEEFTIKVSANVPTTISGYEIRINYNPHAFEYVSTSFTQHSGLNTSASINGEILTLEADSGQIGTGARDIAEITLRAKSNGQATMVIADSLFHDVYGQTIPASRLKYYSFNINISSITPSSSSEQDTSTTIGETDDSDSTEDNVDATTSDLNQESTITSQDSSSSTTLSDSTTESSSVDETDTSLTETSNQETSSNELSYERDLNLNNIIIIALLVLIASIIIALIILLLRRNNSNK